MAAKDKQESKRDQPGVAVSVRDLAKKVSRNPSTVSRWLRREDWPFKSTPPWKVAEVETWAKVALSNDPGAEYKRQLADLDQKQAGTIIERKAKAELQHILERTIKVRTEREILQGKYHLVADCQARRLRAIHATAKDLDAMPRSLAAQLVGLSRAKIEEILKDWQVALRKKFARGYAGEEGGLRRNDEAEEKKETDEG